MQIGRNGFFVACTLASATSTAFADRTETVVLDASGSMTTPRTSGGNRFDAAKSEGALRVTTLSGQVGGLAGGVYVFKFFRDFLGGGGLVPQQDPTTLNICAPVSAGGTGPCTAGQAIRAINAATVSNQNTPLAGSLCDSIDIASASGSGATTARFLDLYTDGAENFTDPAHPCFGPFSVSTSPPYDLGSWQNKVYLHAVNASPAITINPTLYVDVSTFAPKVVNPPPAQLPTTHTFVGALAPAFLAPSHPASSSPFAGPIVSGLNPGPLSLLSDQQFFAQLAADTDGFYREVGDNEPLPVFADIDGDFDVDRDDAIALARLFGKSPTFDTDLDGDDAIGYGDYRILVSRLGTGTGTPAPDPYTHENVRTCFGGVPLVIDGAVIESEGTVISGLNNCQVIIRNSLIVSGGVALRTRGIGIVTIENSIIVGEDGWLTSTGKTILFARNSVFHGKRLSIGRFDYVNRGGNTFE